MTFESLGLDETLLRALQSAGYEQPTEVQARAIPAALSGKDLRVCSNTGSGKTAAFVLPALMRVLEARKDPAHAVRTCPDPVAAGHRRQAFLARVADMLENEPAKI